MARGRLVVPGPGGQEQAGAKFADYFEFSEPLTGLPSHRILAMFRGEKEGVLTLDRRPRTTTPPDRRRRPTTSARDRRPLRRRRPRPAGRPWLLDTVRWAWRTRILVRLGVDLRTRLRQAAEDEAAPGVRRQPARPAAGRAGRQPRRPWASTRASAPASRSRWSTAPARWSPPTPSTRTSRPADGTTALATLARLAPKHGVELVAIGNGTASRETDRLAAELIARAPGARADQGGGLRGRRVGLLRLGATPPPELPELDVSLRGAVSIARRLQDPLAELVKIDPKSIGVGQYQHDVAEAKLARTLDAVVEDCVNAVGRGREHRLGAAADPGGRRRAGAGREHRRAPRRARPVPHSQRS